MLSSYILRMANRGEQTAFIEQGVYRSQFYSYAQVAERARAFAHWLRSKGLGPEPGREAPRILLWAAPGARWAMAFYGCVLASSTVVPVDAGFSADFLRRIAERNHASLLITDRGMGKRDEKEQPQIGEIEQFFIGNLETLPLAPAEADVPVVAGRDSLAEIVYTSGTTAEPRGVMITHGNLLANLEPVEREIRRYETLSIPFRPIRFVHLIPLSHLFGQVTALFIPQFLGGVVIFPESRSPAKLARVIHDRRASVMVSVPQQLEAMGAWARAQLTGSGGDASQSDLERAAEEHWSIPRRWWKFRRVHQRLGWKMWAFVSGGATLPAQVESLWNSLGYAVIQGYGLTETAPAITITHPFKIRRGSVGRPLAGAETRIAEDGEILVRGANVSPGYYQDREATRQSFEDGWLHTGDLGRFDEQGNLIYLGRKKEVIVTAEGLNVYPDDVEKVLREDSAIEEAAVVGRRSVTEVGGSANERMLVHAVIVPAAGAGANDVEAAVSRANSLLEPHQRIRGFSLWPEPLLPRTLSTSKLQRTRIANWLNGEAGPPGPPIVASETEDWRGFLVQLGTPAERIRPEARLAEDLGISSLDRIELLTWLEAHGYQFDEQTLGQAQTIADVENLLQMPPRTGEHPSGVSSGERDGSGAGLRNVRIRSYLERAVAAPKEPRWQISWPAAVAREAAQYLLAFPLLRFYVRAEVHGLEKLQGLRQPVLFISNHQSFFDAPIILRSLPDRVRRRLAAAMGEGAFRGHSKMALFWTRLVFNGYLISDDPARTQEALRHAGWLAEKGYSTLIFPEGERTWEGRLLRFRPGVGVMAERLQLPVVPLLLEGLYDLWPRTRYYPRRGKAQLWIGDITRIRPGESPAEFSMRLEEYYRAWKK